MSTLWAEQNATSAQKKPAATCETMRQVHIHQFNQFIHVSIYHPFIYLSFYLASRITCVYILANQNLTLFKIRHGQQVVNTALPKASYSAWAKVSRWPCSAVPGLGDHRRNVGMSTAEFSKHWNFSNKNGDLMGLS